MIATIRKLASDSGEHGAGQPGSSHAPDGVGGASRTRSLGRVLIGLSLTLLAAAGGLLWWDRGAAVFGELMLAGLAWCL